MDKRHWMAAGVAVLFALRAAGAVAGPEADRCGGAKLKAAARHAKGSFACQASALRHGEAVDPACLATATAKLAATFGQAEARGGCVTADDEGAAQAIADAARVAADSALSPAPTTESRVCASAKMQAAGRYLSVRLNCYGKAASRGLAPAGRCLVVAEDRLASAVAKAESRGGCATVDDAGALRGLAESAAADLVRALSPVCGDSLQGPSQECESSDDAACPDLCNRSCTCDPPPVCGDGVARLPEECDDGDVVDGDGCSSSCQLENASSVCAGTASAPGTALNAVFVSNRFSAPIFLTAPRLDVKRLFVVERKGYVRILKLADDSVLTTPFLDLSDRTTTVGERGFLSMAFDPDYESNGRFFVSYTSLAGDLVLDRYEVDSGNPDLADPSTRKELLVVAHPGASNHNGGQLQFGGDGYLYWSMGDGGTGANAQDDASMLGKMLRLDVNHDSAPFVTVPPTNPGYAGGMSPLEYVWAKGLRNPWRFSFDRLTGDLYIGDVGAGAVEEISFAPAASTGGENYGWNTFEGSTCNKPPCPDPPLGFTGPVHEYTHGGKHCAVIGGYAYRGCAMPGLAGNYFFSDLCSSFVRTFEVSGGVSTNLLDRTKDAKSAGAYWGGIFSWGEDARGEIYLISGNNSIFRMEPE
jgi:cysteine-rich repeat protein